MADLRCLPESYRPLAMQNDAMPTEPNASVTEAAACQRLRIALSKCEQATSGRCEASSKACDTLRAKLKACQEAQ